MLPPLDVHAAALDVCVVGCGPAGLALAAELGALGVNVGLIGAITRHKHMVITHDMMARQATARTETVWECISAARVRISCCGLFRLALAAPAGLGRHDD